MIKIIVVCRQNSFRVLTFRDRINSNRRGQVHTRRNLFNVQKNTTEMRKNGLFLRVYTPFGFSRVICITATRIRSLATQRRVRNLEDFVLGQLNVVVRRWVYYDSVKRLINESKIREGRKEKKREKEQVRQLYLNSLELARSFVKNCRESIGSYCIVVVQSLVFRRHIILSRPLFLNQRR